MIHDSLCDMSSDLIFSNSVCCCAQIAKARAEGFSEGYKACSELVAAQQGMRLSRKATDTQVAAVKATLPRSGTKGAWLWSLFTEAGEYGLTDDEIEVKTGWTHQSASAARNLLMRKGLLTDSGQRRKNRRGLFCIVWTPVSQSREDHHVRHPSSSSTNGAAQ